MARRVNVVIYHAPGLNKVGCTDNFRRRVRAYRSSGFHGVIKVLEKLHGATLDEASQCEWRWADKFGYGRGVYYKTAVRGSSAGGMRTAALGKHMVGVIKAARAPRIGSFGVKRPYARKAMLKAQAASCASPNHVSRQSMCCPFCDFITNRLAMGAHIRKAHTRGRSVLEAKIESRAVKYAGTKGCVCYKLNGIGRRGKDDHIFITPNGYVLWVEFKRGDEVPRKLQQLEHAKLAARHQMHAVTNTFEEFIFKLDWVLRLKVRKRPRGW